MSSQHESSSVHFHSAADFIALRSSPSDVIVIADDLATLTQVTHDGPVGQLASLTEDDAAALRTLAAARLRPAAHNSTSTELSYVSGHHVKRIVLALLPQTFSRHNAPSRCHAVTDIVKSHQGSGNIVVVLVPSRREFAFAQALSAIRPFSLYGHKSTHAAQRRIDVVINYPVLDPATDGHRIRTIGNVAAGIRLCQRLVDAPPNILHTDRYVEECREVARAIGCGIHVIHGHELETQGFGGIWGVGKASEHLPALVILSHLPDCDPATKSVCLVGKGIVYDTGGLSIKDKNSMPGMKVDMGGSAGVLGAFQAAVQSGFDYPFHAVMCIAENSVGPLATRPDDVHVFYSGKSVEINNTDAEGRLVLADGCAYAARNLNPKIIIDMATLTGAQGIATGKRHGALYCNDEWLEELAVRVGRESGDLTHPLPYCPEFFKSEFSSAVADMKNSVKDRTNAQSSCAGQFIGNHIEEFLDNGGQWLHIDMTYPAHAAERATGYGVALLYSLLAEFDN